MRSVNAMFESIESRVLMSAGGNVEFEWKVEEGESAPLTPGITANQGGTTHGAGGGGGAGKVSMNDISFTFVVNKASPSLFRA